MGNCQATGNSAVAADRPGASSYLSQLIYVYFRDKRNVYPVPRQVLKRLKLFVKYFDKYKDASDIHLDIAVEDIGHTIIHYIYTGQYQTLPDTSLPSQGSARQVLEYKRSVHVNCVAIAYGLNGLASLAKEQVRRYEDCVDIYETLAIAREVFPIFRGRPGVLNGYLEYLRAKMISAFNIDNDCFKRDEILEFLGQVSNSEKFVLKNVLELHSCVTLAPMDTMRFTKEVEEMENVGDTDGTVDEGECSETSPSKTWFESKVSKGSAPDYEVSSTDPETLSSDSEEPWSELESLTDETELIGYW